MTTIGPDEMPRAVEKSMEELIERSSLGAPEAKAIRDSVPKAAARRVVALARYLETVTDCPEGHEFCEGNHLPIRRCQYRRNRHFRCLLTDQHAGDHEFLPCRECNDTGVVWLPEGDPYGEQVAGCRECEQ